MSAPNKVAQRMWKARPVLDALPLQFYRNRQRHPVLFSVQWLPDIITSRIAALNPDVVNLHWIGDGFVAAEALSEFNKPIVWTLHDMSAFTGGCCYSQECVGVSRGGAIATPNPVAIVLYSAIIKAGICPAGFGSEKRKHGKI